MTFINTSVNPALPGKSLECDINDMSHDINDMSHDMIASSCNVYDVISDIIIWMKFSSDVQGGTMKN